MIGCEDHFWNDLDCEPLTSLQLQILYVVGKGETDGDYNIKHVLQVL